jgi:hypothetical protein
MHDAELPQRERLGQQSGGVGPPAVTLLRPADRRADDRLVVVQQPAAARDLGATPGDRGKHPRALGRQRPLGQQVGVRDGYDVATGVALRVVEHRHLTWVARAGPTCPAPYGAPRQPAAPPLARRTRGATKTGRRAACCQSRGLEVARRPQAGNPPLIDLERRS